ncbi:E2F-associated phosphoprotein, partial [Smittium culicis]
MNVNSTAEQAESEEIEELEEDFVKDELYDSDIDAKNELWVSQKLGVRKKKGRGESKSSTKLKKANNVLSCPGCFTIICFDSQQHEKYKEQYRAILVENCRVDSETIFEEDYNPVHCSSCQNHVGYVDRDQVYHFFNVLSG